jgi:hypothetical protein
VAGYSAHNVFTRINGTDICLDHHGAAPHNNLWTEIDVVGAPIQLLWSWWQQEFGFCFALQLYA